MFSDAVNYLYQKCGSQFIAAYINFVMNHDSFKRWTYRFEEWIEATFMPILKQFEPSDNSFSVRILNMIESDFSKIPFLRISNDPNGLTLIKELFASTEQYISSLEKLSSLIRS